MLLTRTISVTISAQACRCGCPSYGIMLLSRAQERDVVGTTVPEIMAAAEKRLQQLSEETLSDTAFLAGWMKRSSR